MNKQQQTSTQKILIYIRNCTLPNFKVTIDDLADPKNCSHTEAVLTPAPEYHSITSRNKDPITLSGNACTQWLSQKPIATNFFLVHDTIPS